MFLLSQTKGLGAVQPQVASSEVPMRPQKKDGRHCVVMLWFNSFSSILVLLDDWHPRPIQTQYSIHNSWKMSEYLFFCAIQSGYFTCGTPSPREYELVTNMSNEVDLNDEIMEHSFTLIFEMSCVYNLPKKIEITFHISNAIASLIIWIQGIWNYNKSWNDFIVLCCKLMWFQFSTYIQKIYIHDAATFFFLERCPAYLPNMLLKNSQREKHLFKQFSWTI